MTPLTVDAQLREERGYDRIAFPAAFYRDELTVLPNRAGPLHWHPDFELLTAETGTLDYQVGQQHVTLEAGDSIFVNENVLHGIKQIAGEETDPMPNIVFSGTLVAPEPSAIYQKYILPIVRNDALPFIVFRHGDNAINRLIQQIYAPWQHKTPGYEMQVQRGISALLQEIYFMMDRLPALPMTRMQVKNQVRMQKVLTCIYTRYPQELTLADIAAVADVSRSEAGRCFAAYMGCSPIDALLRYRLQIAQELLHDETKTIREISEACGFHSVDYFRRQFKKRYGTTPGETRTLGK